MAKSIAKYRRRRLVSSFIMSLCWLASALGIAMLFAILATLIIRGAGGLSWEVFTQDEPVGGDPGGGLRMAIVGSLIMTVLGTLIGTPIGILAGTYMAEYGRHSRITAVVRFINDILLSAPSIVIGLFIYQIMVRSHVPPLDVRAFGYGFKIDLFGHFSAWAGAVALAVLVIPIVVRTTENMLLLVPNQLREAASAIGMPRFLVIRYVAYRAAMAGMVTGVLLAVARISGETAPLIFTAFGNSNLSFNPNGAMSSLPHEIFKLASFPNPRWNELAWTGALIITAAVLLLSIVARRLSSSGVKS
jgi:phosphate transport system permease protein